MADSDDRNETRRPATEDVPFWQRMRKLGAAVSELTRGFRWKPRASWGPEEIAKRKRHDRVVRTIGFAAIAGLFLMGPAGAVALHSLFIGMIAFVAAKAVWRSGRGLQHLRATAGEMRAARKAARQAKEAGVDGPDKQVDKPTVDDAPTVSKAPEPEKEKETAPAHTVRRIGDIAFRGETAQAYGNAIGAIEDMLSTSRGSVAQMQRMAMVTLDAYKGERPVPGSVEATLRAALITIAKAPSIGGIQVTIANLQGHLYDRRSPQARTQRRNVEVKGRGVAGHGQSGAKAPAAPKAPAAAAKRGERAVSGLG